MAYTAGIFYMDYVNGSDAARTTLSDVVFSNPSGTTVLGTKVGHGLITGACITVSGCTQAYANTVWKITRVDDDTFTVDTALWASWNGADVTGNVVPFGGQSWADAWKTITDGATAARIQPGDTVRIAKSGDPVSTGVTSTWVKNTNVGGLVNATKNVQSSTDATPIVVTCNGHGFSDGQIVQIWSHTTNLKANGFWVVANKTDNTFELEGSVGMGAGAGSGGYAHNVSERGIVLSEKVTQQIENLGAAWTAGTNVTQAARTAGGKGGVYYVYIQCSAGHAGAGIIASQGLASSLDLSGYQQISFWLSSNSVALAAGDLLIKLYSDAACTVEVESLTVPAAYQSANYPITINKGSALSATVQGIAIYATKAMPSKIFTVSNFVACKAAGNAKCITHQTLISKSSAADITSEPWLAIDSINDKVLIFSGIPDGTPLSTNGTKGYFGTSSTGSALYTREPICTIPVSATNTKAQEILDSGTAGNVITFEGGWNTGTNERDGITLFSGVNGYGYGIYAYGRNYISMNHIGVLRYYTGLYFYSLTDLTVSTPYCSHNGQQGLYFYSVTRLTVDTIGCITQNGAVGLLLYNSVTYATFNTIYYLSGNAGNNAYGLGIASSANHITFGTIYQCNGNHGHGINGGSYNMIFYDIQDCSYNYGSGFYVDYGGVVHSITGQNNNNNLVYTNNTNGLPLLVYNITSAGGNGSGTIHANGVGTKIYNVISSDSVIFETGSQTILSSMISIGKVNGDIYDNRIYYDGASALMQSTTTQTGSGYAWKIIPGSTRLAMYPVRLALAQVLCAANEVVTVSAYMKKDHATNVACKLAVRGHQLAGMTATEYSDTKADDTDWELLSFTFTPTEIGVVEIEAVCWYVAGASNCYVDTLTVTQ